MGKELELAIKIGGRLDKSLGSAVNNAQKQLDSISKVANKVGMAVTAGVVTAGSKLVVDSVNTYRDYQSAINSAAATGGIEVGTAAYEALDKAAREAGASTVKTAEESANALEYMMLAGWSVTESTQALLPVLKLSASTGADLATTSDLVTDSMANMGLGIESLSHYLDVSAAANNKTNQTATQLQEAYIGVGATLKNLNSPIEESAAVLGVLANRGTKGSEAGTKLSAVLVNMQKTSGDSSKAMKELGVSMYDSSGNARSIIDVFQDISDKTAGMTEEQRNLMFQMIGGKANVGAFSKIMAGFTDTTADGKKEVYSLIEAFQNCDGALDNLYDIKTDTLEGSITTLNSAFDNMKINIGERIAPILKESASDLTDKMPDIENVIVNSLEKIIPAMSKVLNYVVNNADSIISTVTGIAKAFVGFKITTGAIKGVNNIATLGKNLSTLSKSKGVTKVLQGVIGTFTGVGTAAGTFGSTVTGAMASIATAALPIAGVTASVVALGYAAKAAYDIWYKYSYKWGDSLEKQANTISTQVDEITKLSAYKKELSDLNLVINSPESSTEQISAAQARIKEIGDLLSEEYNLTINTDTGDLQQVAQDVTTVVDALNTKARRETDQDIAKYIDNLNGTVDRYKSATTDLASKQVEKDILSNQSELMSGLLSSAVTQTSAFDMSGDLSTYVQNMQNIARKLSDNGLLDEINKFMPEAIDPTRISDQLTNENTLQNFLSAMHSADTEINSLLDDANQKLTDTTNSITKFEQSAQSVGDSLGRLLVSDILNGDAVNIDNDIERFEILGKTLVEAGANTNAVATKFATAKAGYTDFAAAISDGKAGEIAQNFFDYSTAIGETREAAVQGAALIKNGFENATQATKAGDEAITNILADMKSLGDMQGLFDGLNADGVADKLTDMAHAMQLIPENKSITIDANGNFQVIQEAENQIASLNSVGNVSVSVDADGNISILNKATQEGQILQGLGAVSLKVNANGNIDVLNKAQEKVATIDAKTAKPSVTANDMASTIINNVNDKLVALNGKKAKTTVITEYKTKGTPPENNAAGTSNWRGGLTYVNDQNISDPREVIEHNGMRYWYEGKNVLADIPRGAKIYNALRSRSFINGSHRNGLERVPFDGYIAELHAGERVLTDNEANDYRENGLFAQAIERLKEEFLGGGKPKPQADDNGGEKQIIFSPTYQINGNTDKEEIREASRMSFKDFKEFYERMKRDERRKSF